MSKAIICDVIILSGSRCLAFVANQTGGTNVPGSWHMLTVAGATFDICDHHRSFTVELEPDGIPRVRDYNVPTT